MAEFTTADDGLDPTGWYPGKKHGFVKNLGRVASMGIYSPDNRLATRLNVQRLETRGQNQEGVRHMKELHQLALDSLRDYYAKAHPEWDPEKVSQMSASAFASKALADTEENNARGAHASVDIEKAKGLLPGAAGAATKGQEAAVAAADASTARNRNVEANERGRAPREFEEGANAISAQINNSNANIARSRADGADANNRELRAVAAKTFNVPFKAGNLDSINIDAQQQEVKSHMDDLAYKEKLDALTRPITGNTMVEDAQRHAVDVQNAKLNSGAMNTLLQNPDIAKAAATGVLNQHSLAVPYGGAVIPNVPVDQSTAIQGETRHPDSIEYGQGISPVTGLPVPIIKRKVYGSQGTNQPPSTADFNGLNGKRGPIPIDPAALNAILGGR